MCTRLACGRVTVYDRHLCRLAVTVGTADGSYGNDFGRNAVFAMARRLEPVLGCLRVS